MDKINVAIADDSIEADEILSRMVLEDDSLRLVGKAHTEQEFMQLLREKSLDIVIFDTVVPKLRRTNRRISVTNSAGRNTVKYKIQENGLKLRETDTAGLEVKVTELFRELGIPAHIRGYHYLRDSIILSVNDREMLGSVTKLLYPEVARKYATTPSRVERAIRHAIELSWMRGQKEKLNEIFSFTMEKGKGKPTNSEFIALISDKVRLEWMNNR